MTLDVNAIFEEELSLRGVAFVKRSEYEYVIEIDDFKVTANLFNVARNAEREGDPDAIRRFVDDVFDAFPPNPPPWIEASKLLLFSAEHAYQDFGDAIASPVSDEVCRVLTLTDQAETKITFVTPKICDDWGVTVEEANQAATRNQDRLLDGIQLQVEEIEGDALGMIPVNSPYKASVIFAGTFKEMVEPILGWPVLAVLPCRDFIYVVKNDSPLLGKMGSVVVNEFQKSGYPITTEVLRITDDGIEAIGKYPT